jgi:hypothetical protein
MGFLRRQRAMAVPWWVEGFMDAAQYEAFDAALQADLRSRQWRYRQHDDAVFVEGAPGTEPTAYGLTNLAQLCAGIDRSQWPTAIKDHFDHVSTVGDGSAVEPGWDDVRPLLKLRIVPADLARAHDMVGFPLTPEIVAVLAVDYPTAVQMLSPQTIDGWPPVDELHAIALENLRADPSPSWQRVGGGPEAFLALFDDSFFTAARVLLLPEGVDLGGAREAVVAMPNRHVLLVHPIHDVGVVNAIRDMTVHTARLFDEGPGSIASDLFWWHEGSLTTIPVKFDGTSAFMFPPDAFVERMNGLGEAPTG